MLNLEDFISQSLVQIVNGVVESQKRVAELGAKINPTDYVVQPNGELNWSKSGYGRDDEIGQVVEFDVAVVAGENKDIKGGMGVFVTGLTVGYQAGKTKENSSVSRVKFYVPLFLPQQKKQGNDRKPQHRLPLTASGAVRGGHLVEKVILGLVGLFKSAAGAPFGCASQSQAVKAYSLARWIVVTDIENGLIK